jgi:uncharacterized repeat protein (TIGR02543 family)
VKKGKKIGKLPTTPKRVGYTFKGWYTKKIGGTKISKNTIIKKNTIYYAQWIKRSTSLSTDEKMLVKTWVRNDYVRNKLILYIFKNDGTFEFWEDGQYYSTYYDAKLDVKGNYKVSSGKLYLTNLKSYSGDTWPNMVVEYSFGKENGKTTLNIARLYKTPYIDMKDARIFK